MNVSFVPISNLRSMTMPSRLTAGVRARTNVIPSDAGVEHIWGDTGDSLNGLSDSLRRLGRIAWMHVRHEEVAAFAAGAEAAETVVTGP